MTQTKANQAQACFFIPGKDLGGGPPTGAAWHQPKPNQAQAGIKKLFPLSLLLFLPALICHFMPNWTHWLEWNRAALEQGQYWRHLTGHWTHWDSDQLLYNGLAFAALGALCENLNPKAWRRTLLLAIPAVSATMWWAQTDFPTYRGLSGLDSALYVLLATLLLRHKKDPTTKILALLGLAAFLGKVGYESLSGTTLFATDTGTYTPLPLTHLVGGLCGLLAGLGRRGGY